MDVLQTSPKVSSELVSSADFKRVLADALSIQDRFSAEPIFARTGKGHLKSAGVKELQSARSKTHPVRAGLTKPKRG